MILSERGAIRAAIADGGFHLYPAGNFVETIKTSLAGDDLKGNFDPQRTIEKIRSVAPPAEEHLKTVFEEDVKLLCSRLEETDAEYNIESVFTKMAEVLPAMAKRYYGIDGFEPVHPQIVEYFFEGHNEIYKDADWYAFNVNEGESRELNVPVGTYFKRDQVSPGIPEFSVMHEANHAMQEKAALPQGVHHYIPWLDEGLADIFGRMMLYGATENEKLLKKVKIFRAEVEVTDPRKMTYHYGEETAALLLLRGRLPLVKALLKARQKDPYSIDWNQLAVAIRTGVDPHIAIMNSYCGTKKETFAKQLTRDETNFRKEADLNQADLRIISMFLASQRPATLSAAEYRAALWFAAELKKAPSPHFLDPNAIPEGLRGQVNDWKADALMPFSSIPEAVTKKVGGLETKMLIRSSDVPETFREGATALANKYFIVKRVIGDAEVYEPYGGGLPYRLGSGELRCAW